MRHLSAFTVILYITLFSVFNGYGKIIRNVEDSTYSFTSNSSPASINIRLRHIKFTAQPHQRFNFGLTTNEYCYILIKLQCADSLKAYLLSIDNTSLDTILIYSIANDHSRQLLYKGGNLLKYDRQRNYVWHTIPLRLFPEPQFFLIAMKATGKNVNVQYKIHEQAGFQKIYSAFDKLIYFYMGVVSLIALISLIACSFLRNRILIFYLCYILSVSCWVLAHYGYLFPLLYPDYPGINNIAKVFAIMLAMFFFMQFTAYLFKINLTSQIAQRILSVFSGMCLVTCLVALIYLINPFPPAYYAFFNISWHIILLLSISIVIAVLIFLFKVNRTARIFSLAVSAPIGMAIFQIVANTGGVNNNFIKDHGFLLAILVEIVILSFAIVYTIWEEKKIRDARVGLLEEEQKQTLQRLINLQDSERKRIAEELHDSIGPMLAAIKINVMRLVKTTHVNEASEALSAKTESIIDDSISEIRSISHQLMPKGLSSKGLIMVLAEYFEDLQNIYPVYIHFTHNITVSLPDEVQLNLYRIICELVLNAAKHSKCTHIDASIATNTTETTVTICDNGKGFNPAQKDRMSLGLKNAESRVGYLKGKMTIRSSPLQGTAIEIWIPIG